MRNPHEREALVAGMTLVPALLSRNRNFALFEDPEMRRVRVRAALLRGIVRQLAGAEGKVESLEVLPRSGAREGAHQGAYQSGFELRYRLPGVRVSRRAVLTDLEYSCVAYLAGRASVAGLAADDEDRARIDTALRRLSAGLRLAEIDGGLGV